MNRRAQAVTMLLLGGALLRATFADLHLRYVKEALGPFLIAAGAVLVAAGAMTLWYDLFGSKADAAADLPECADDGHSGEDGHGQRVHKEPRVGWMLLLPVLGLLLVSPPALGAYAAGQAGSALSTQQQSDFPALPPGDPIALNVSDYAARAVFDKGVSLQGRTVELTGFLAANPEGGQYLARMVLSCCAADGRPIKVGLAGDAPTGQADDRWVKITGVYNDRIGADPVNKSQIPYLQVTAWAPTEQPRNPYE
ncbi:membrane protein [Pilimelia terevasa]|uniref:Membrane protein n=1 Tax=Pilimelia terevasa TaxID=53372 RepID=A0A8J3FM03_9ACTN|nr:TIGR03943 family protein [Pilimelia terevasa]GGK41298.1 membrane protein [Pilimelia terevasa]